MTLQAHACRTFKSFYTIKGDHKSATHNYQGKNKVIPLDTNFNLKRHNVAKLRWIVAEQMKDLIIQHKLKRLWKEVFQICQLYTKQLKRIKGGIQFKRFM